MCYSELPTVLDMASHGAKSVGPYYSRIVRKLTDAFAPSRLVLVDDSASHAGHAGNPGGGETHFRLEITSSQFEGVRLLERQRQVYNVLSEELEEKVHALSMSTKTPAEDSSGN